MATERTINPDSILDRYEQLMNLKMTTDEYDETARDLLEDAMCCIRLNCKEYPVENDWPRFGITVPFVRE